MAGKLPTWVWVLGSAALGVLIGYALSRALERTPKRLTGNKRGPTRPTKRKAIEAISESDDAVRRNVPPELIPIFNRIKGRIKGKRTRDRTEAFLEWVEEHPEDVVAMQAGAAESEIKRLVSAHEADEHERYAAAEAEHEAEVARDEREAIAEAAVEVEDTELAELAERYAAEPDPEEAREEYVAGVEEYGAWAGAAPPTRADEDISDAEFFRRLEVVEGPAPAARRSQPRRKGAGRPKGRPRPKAASEAPSGPVRALLPARGESQSA